MEFTRKAAFFDLDGTLACNNRPLLPADADAIRRLRREGHMAFLCTGRAPGFLYKEVLDVGFDGVVAGAGAHITVGDELLYRRLVPPEDVRRVVAYYQGTCHTCILEGERDSFCISRGAIYSCFEPVPEHPAPGWYEENPITKLTIMGQLDEPARQLLASYYIIQHPTYAEAVPHGCNKADGMRRVLEYVGISRENSLAFGDSYNDLDMLRYAGFAVAMGIADETIRAAADYVTDTQEYAGVSKALWKFVLSPRGGKGD